MIGETHWAPALIALAVGLVVGGVLWLRSRRGPRAAVPIDPRLAERDRLLARLSALGAGASDSVTARERALLELEAARLLRDLDRVPARLSAPAAASADSSVPRRPSPKVNRAGRLVLLGVWAAATLLMLGILVRDAARPRESEEGAAAGPSPSPDAVVGGVLSLAPGLTLPPDAMLFITARAAGERRGPPVAAAGGVVSRFPIGFELSNEHSMLGAQFPDEATIEARIDFDGDPLTRAPGEPSAIVEGVKRGTMDLGLVLTVDGAAAAVGAGRPSEPSASDAPALRGTITWEHGRPPELPEGAALFLLVRRAGVRGGPPIAAQKLDPTRLPASFVISGADSMLGQSLPELADVEARVDFDGDPGTRDPAEASALATGVAPGPGEIRLVLKPRS